ncbi:hypothetical protein ANO11243_021650 [Dothideomycetidae sp. 11243]|nr:hypothetical protein ANO11243_021650 [fungal sp. No.11243]
MAVAEEPIEFTVRPLPRGNTIDGAFRVHISSKDLENLNIKPGDVCRIRTAEGATGSGIAWRSTDPITKTNTHPIKLTDTLRDAFNLKLGNIVTVTKSSGQIYHADKVIVTEVSEHDTSEDAKDDNTSVEAIANGIAFEATSRKGLRKRFLIESINSSTKESSSLFYLDDKTEVIMQDESAGPTLGLKTSSLRINSEGIRGLDRQLVYLNERMEVLLGGLNCKLPRRYCRNGGILLFGPRGTGKSMLLERIAAVPWRKVLRVDGRALSGSSTRHQTIINGIFTEALAQQPCVIIMDRIQSIAGSRQDDTYKTDVADILDQEFDRLKNTKVLVVATASHPSAVNQTLRGPGRFTHELEIPVPDQKARAAILKAFHDEDTDPSAEFDNTAETIGARTHGYVGADLEELYQFALDQVYKAALSAEKSASVNGSDSDSFTTLFDRSLSIRSRTSISTFASADRAPAQLMPLGDPTIEDFEFAMLKIQPTAMKEVFVDPPKVQWSQIGGCEEIRRLLTKGVEWPLKHKTLMDSFKRPAQKGILLYGPPGCSKTMTAQAIATSSGLNFLAVKGAELISMYVGESERAIREVFRKARAAAPSIIFFDEIDSIAGERGAANTGLNVLTTLLNEMDGIEGLKGVLVLAATNKPGSLDPALLRPGRFDKVHYIGPPNTAARREIFKLKAQGVPVAPDVDFDALAARTEGFSGADCVGVWDNTTDRVIERILAAREANDSSADSAEAVCAGDFDAVLACSVSSVPRAMVEEFERWQPGL